MAKILVIEDNPANVKLAVFLLEKAGHEVLTAEDAAEGIELSKRHLLDLVLMDIQLPGMDGLAATRALKSDPATRAIKVVALTAFAMKGDEAKMLAAGCDGYIAKPFQYREFLDRVEAILKRMPGDGSSRSPRNGNG